MSRHAHRLISRRPFHSGVINPSGIAPPNIGDVLTFPGFAGSPAGVTAVVVDVEDYLVAAPRDASCYAGAGTPPIVSVYGAGGSHVPANGYSYMNFSPWGYHDTNWSANGSAYGGTYDPANLSVQPIATGSPVGDSLLRTRCWTGPGGPSTANWSRQLGNIPGMPQPPANPLGSANAPGNGYGTVTNHYTWGLYAETCCLYPSLPGYKRARLFWSQTTGRTTANRVNANGEIDVWEFIELISGNSPSMYYHLQGQLSGDPDGSNGNQVSRPSGLSTLVGDGKFHRYGVLWIPGLLSADGTTSTGGLLRGYIDGVQIGSDFTGPRIPSATMRLVGQIETKITASAPPTSTDGEVLTDWDFAAKITVGLPA